MQETALVIRSQGLRGYGASIVLAFTLVWAIIAAFLYRIWTRPAALTLWVILVVFCLIAAGAVEVVFRLNYVKVAHGQLRWRFRQGDRGQRPLNAVREVERIGSSTRIVFSEGEPLLVSGMWFRPRDIDALISALEASRAPEG